MPLILLIVHSANGVLQTLETTSTAASNGLDCEKFLSISGSPPCPPWTYPNRDNTSCECGDSIGRVVRCKTAECTHSMAIPTEVEVRQCYCMSYSEKLGMVVLGACPYLCTPHLTHIPHYETELNKTCNHNVNQHRTGDLCGRCIDGYAPSAYTSGLQCADCSDYQRNWLKYVAIAYLPLILLYLVVLLFRLNILSGRMTACIFFCQIIACPTFTVSTSSYFNSKMSNSSIYLSNFIYNHEDFVLGSVKSVYLLYGVWNLDFYRLLFEPLCLNPSMSTLQVFLLDYAIALFPMILIAITFFIVKLYDRFKIVQYFWRPIVRLFALLRKLKCDVNISLIETFGTFILLSYVKVLDSSLSILMPVQVMDVTGRTVGTYLYYNGSVEYFGRDHLPYAVLAIFMFTTFNLMPLLLLCLYPCRCFQSCLNCCRLNSQELRTFMDAFQGCYKFEPYDCRYFSGFYLFLRIAILLVFYSTHSGFFYVVTGMIMVPVVFLVSVIRPYRETRINTVDIGLLLVFVLFCFSAALHPLSSHNHAYLLLSVILLCLTLAIPPVYMLVIAVYSLLLKPCHSLVRNYHQRRTSMTERGHFLTDATPLLSGVRNTEGDEALLLPQSAVSLDN